MKKQELTDRQSEVLTVIADYIKDNGFPPTRMDISDEMGFSSPNAAQEHLEALERKGWIKVLPAISRGLVVL